MWPFSNLFFNVINRNSTRGCAQAEKVWICLQMWSKRGNKNTILLNGIYLVLSPLFIQLRSSGNDRGGMASKVTTYCQYQSWSLIEFKHLPFLLSQHLLFLLFLTLPKLCNTTDTPSTTEEGACRHLSAIIFSLVIHYVRFLYFCLIPAPASSLQTLRLVGLELNMAS